MSAVGDATRSAAHRAPLRVVGAAEERALGDADTAWEGPAPEGGAALPASGDREVGAPSPSFAGLDDEPPVCREGEQYGAVVIRRFVTRGGMGEVYEAYHPHMDQRVALKVLRKHYRDRAEFVERFRDEGRLLAAICQKEPNVVQIRDVGFDPRCGPFITMEWLVGKNFSDLIDAWGGSIPVAQAVHLAIRVADVTHRVHLLGLIHRDLKPANLFLERIPGGDPRLVLLDLGIAKRIGGARTTDENRTLGTIEYMAPEQITTGRATVQSDVYALGIILHEMLSGDHPFGAAAREALAGGGDDQRHLVIMGGHLYGTIEPLARQIAPEAEGPGGERLSLADIVARATRREPEERPASMEALATELRRWLAAHRAPIGRRAAPARIEGLREAVDGVIPAVGGSAGARGVAEEHGAAAARRTARIELPVATPVMPARSAPREPIGPVEMTAIVSGCSLLIGWRGHKARRFPLLDAVTRIGREGGEADLVVEHPTVSRAHCELRHVVPGVFQVVDLGSTHGLVIEGIPARAGILRIGQQLRLGDVFVGLVGPGGWRRGPDGKESFVSSAVELPPAERATVRMVGDPRAPLGATLEANLVLGRRRGPPSSRAPARREAGRTQVSRVLHVVALVALGLVAVLAVLRLGMAARDWHDAREAAP